jgi:hypothetical protein
MSAFRGKKADIPNSHPVMAAQLNRTNINGCSTTTKSDDRSWVE